jgi:putative transposase
LNDEMLEQFEAISIETLQRWRGALLEFNGEVDHVHLLVRLPPDVAPSRVIGSLKSRSSRLLRRDWVAHLRRFYWKPILWSASYCIVSCGGAPLSVIRQYIEQQNRPL